MRKKVSMMGIIVGAIFILVGIATYLGAFAKTPDIETKGKVAQAVLSGTIATNATISHVGGLLILAIGALLLISQLSVLLQSYSEPIKKPAYVYESGSSFTTMPRNQNNSFDYSQQPFVVDNTGSRAKVPLFMVGEPPNQTTNLNDEKQKTTASYSDESFLSDNREGKVHSFLASSRSDKLAFVGAEATEEKPTLKSMIMSLNDRLTISGKLLYPKRLIHSLSRRF